MVVFCIVCDRPSYYYETLSTFATLKRGVWAELTFAMTSGIVTRKRGKNQWPIADRFVVINDAINNCGTLFGYSSLIVSYVASLLHADLSGVKRKSLFCTLILEV